MLLASLIGGLPCLSFGLAVWYAGFRQQARSFVLIRQAFGLTFHCTGRQQPAFCSASFLGGAGLLSPVSSAVRSLAAKGYRQTPKLWHDNLEHRLCFFGEAVLLFRKVVGGYGPLQG